jgi:hypothetical protein
MSTLSDFTAALDDLAPGSHPVDTGDLDDMRAKAVAKAMDTHGKHRPRMVVEDVSGTGGFDYALADLASWSDGMSAVSQVEYPVDDTDENTAMLEGNDWMIYTKPAGNVLRLLNAKPAATESIRITYTARHSCTVTDCTVAAADEEAVQSLAAAYYCKMLAAVYALDQDSTIAADTVNQGPRHRAFMELSAKYRAEYDDHMGITPGKPKPAVAISDQDVNYPGGMDRLTHPRRYR